MHRCIFLGGVFIALLGFSEGLTAAQKLRTPSDMWVLLKGNSDANPAGVDKGEGKMEERGIQVRLHKRQDSGIGGGGADISCTLPVCQALF